MHPADLASIYLPASPSLDPTGAQVVYAVSRPDPVSNRYESSLWRLKVTGGAEPVRLTHGDGDTAPAYSPDGRWIAFRRAVGSGHPQLWLIASDGGDGRCLTAAPLGVDVLRWSPDSSRIAYTARVPEPGRYGTDPDVDADHEPPRLIHTRSYLQDGLGYRHDRPMKVFVVEIEEDAEPVQVTHGPGDDESPVWLAPDGPGSARIAFIARRTAGGAWRPDTLRSDVCSVRPDGKKFRRHTPGSGSTTALVTDPAGRLAYYL